MTKTTTRAMLCDAVAERKPAPGYTLTTIIETEVNCAECKTILETL